VACCVARIAGEWPGLWHPGAGAARKPPVPPFATLDLATPASARHPDCRRRTKNQRYSPRSDRSDGSLRIIARATIVFVLPVMHRFRTMTI
jgi:hypothetical protein